MKKICNIVKEKIIKNQLAFLATSNFLFIILKLNGTSNIAQCGLSSYHPDNNAEFPLTMNTEVEA